MDFRVNLVASILALGLAATSVGGAQAQSISQALTIAYDHAPELQAALLEAKASAENIALANAGMRPRIGASVGGTYAWSAGQATQGNPNGNFTDSTSYTAGLSYEQTIFDNHKTDAQIEAARAGAEAAEHQIRNTEQNVLLAVVQAYMSVLSGRQLVALRQENVNFFQAQLQSAQDRLDVGEGTRIDVAQAEARLAQGQATYRAAVSSLEISQATFQRYVGVAPQNLDSSHNYGRLVPASLQAAISEAEVGHPAILLSKAAIRAAQASTDAAQAAFGPSASVNGSVGTGFSNPGGSQGLSGRLGFTITVPLYSGGALGAGVRKANIEQIKSEVDAMSAYDQIREAVISAWAGMQSADAQISAANSAVSAGRTVLDGVIQERDLGTRTTLDVLNSQAELTTAREGLINASTNKVIATFSLLSAMGRLTAADLGLAVEIKSAVRYNQAVEDVWQELRTVAE
ncbi:MAG: TolC family outer membrane protein [Devosia sp.]|jgi:outer membrane protein|uniref:TolC family outer membrane protein n=1 Tax=Devosia sp. XGJD_8 TaxID=3391187 RepID=UPI001D851B10|nr:TolC family outer membrane protein [Alphaproteobacteria bacterium]MBU1561923.1 TolC family outer membrane protein [Alphaproteobacteria bacterium]MBU2304479.1 TolC family outer membrane protein [Alphaproteobacteria bacterium]MBU2367834.1 TolC family outer membrane protein [Alphaproteobacteria bacterium]